VFATVVIASLFAIRRTSETCAPCSPLAVPATSGGYTTEPGSNGSTVTVRLGLALEVLRPPIRPANLDVER
jgi:hypothetical protein